MCMQYFDLFCFYARQDAVHSPKSVSNFNVTSLGRALVFYMAIIHHSQIFIQSNMLSQIKTYICSKQNVRAGSAPFTCFVVEVLNLNVGNMRAQSKCASYYFARQN